MAYITKVDLARNAKLFSGDTSNLDGSIVLGENLTVEGDVIFSGLTTFSGSTAKGLVRDPITGKVYEGTSSGNGGGSGILTQELKVLLATPNLGGVANNQIFVTDTPIENIIRNLLIETAYPTYVNPTLNLINTNGTTGVKEIGSSLTSNFTNNFVKNDVGAIINMKFYKDNILLNTFGATPNVTSNVSSQFGYESPNNPNYLYTTSLSDIMVVPNGNVEYKTIVSYEPGLPKRTNTNILDTRVYALRNTNAPQNGDNNYSSNVNTVIGVYPFYFGKSLNVPSNTEIQAAVNSGLNKVVSKSNSTVVISFSAVGEYIWFAIPQTSTSKTTWYVDSLNSGAIGGITNLFSNESTLLMQSNLWNNVNYKVYRSNYPTTTEGSMELRN